MGALERALASCAAKPAGTIGALAVIGVAAYLSSPRLQTTINPFSHPAYVTAVGETRGVSLEDGSRIMLDTRLPRAHLLRRRRAADVELLEVRRISMSRRITPGRFRVRTRSAEVIAVGTSFDVAARPLLRR